ncbi:hypothetical protein F2P81_009243 [Scophthalmus maximus]|uniref:Uncharacterized protein n=1 Tax=Scophthalmus maximus TaxID=52904 RepID=A0A6A4T188_SCOMX|nr:hypothetical protein F2P81_009243 [Scophthalmus maximus]
MSTAARLSTSAFTFCSAKPSRSVAVHGPAPSSTAAAVRMLRCCAQFAKRRFQRTGRQMCSAAVQRNEPK